MQLYKNRSKPPGFIKTGVNIVQKEGFLSLYKGLGAVVIGIVPKWLSDSVHMNFTVHSF